MDAHFPGNAPGGTGETQQQGGKDPVSQRSLAPMQQSISKVVERSLTAMAVALKPRCEGNRVIMGLYHLPSTQPAWTRREPGGAHENPETIIRPTALDLSP